MGLMENLREACRKAFGQSRKLKQINPSERQLDNVERRLREIFTDEELEQLDERDLTRQVERVWPIARFVDRDPEDLTGART